MFRGKVWAGDANVGFIWPEIWMGLLRGKEQRGEAVHKLWDLNPGVLQHLEAGKRGEPARGLSNSHLGSKREIQNGILAGKKRGFRRKRVSHQLCQTLLTGGVRWRLRNENQVWERGGSQGSGALVSVASGDQVWLVGSRESSRRANEVLLYRRTDQSNGVVFGGRYDQDFSY